MSFVNAFILPEEYEKYGLKEIDKRFTVGGTKARDWTIDRDRDIYLRNVVLGGGNDPDLRNQTKWSFYWQGDLLTLRLDLIEGSGGRGEPGWSHWRLMWINGDNGLPGHLERQHARILDTLKEALTTYQGGGVYSTEYTSYSVTLDIDKDCSL